jgi:hypothetical protein
MTSSFTAYIDESGDEGFVFLPGEKGSSRWLVLSAVAFRKAKDWRLCACLANKRAKKCRPQVRVSHPFGLPVLPLASTNLALACKTD